MTKAEVKIFMKKVKEAGDKVLDEETALMKVIMNLYKRKDGI